MDRVDSSTRSRMMSGIRSSNTKPEILVRKCLHALGFRYRVNVRKLIGTPDIVFPKYRAVLFIHGCFWHGHDCSNFKVPKTRTDFWLQKIKSNKERDVKVQNQLYVKGWRICIVWECAIKGKEQLSGLDATIGSISDWIKSDKVFMEVSMK